MFVLFTYCRLLIRKNHFQNHILSLILEILVQSGRTRDFLSGGLFELNGPELFVHRTCILLP